MTSWVRDAYRGYLWPFLSFAGGIGYGTGWETHSWWRYATWPCLTVAVFSVNMAQSKIKKVRP